MEVAEAFPVHYHLHLNNDTITLSIIVYIVTQLSSLVATETPEIVVACLRVTEYVLYKTDEPLVTIHKAIPQY